MKRVRIGIIGCGTIAEAQAMAAKQLEKTELVAVSEVIEENAKSFEKKMGINHVFTDYKKMLESDLIDAINNCTPKFMDKQVVVDAAKSKKHR